MGYRKRGYMSGRSRLTLALFSILCFTSSAIYGQSELQEINVSISARNKTINQILDEMTLQTGYYFTYNSALISGKQKVQFRVSNLLLEEALDSLLKDASFDYRLIDRNIVIYKKNIISPVPIDETINRSLLKGVVVDSRSGKPLPFATLALYGTSLGSISNQEGEFSFKIPTDLSDPMLVVSYMGYKNLLLPVRYPLEKSQLIQLEKEMIPLQEVIIRIADPELLLTEAIKRIPDNYLEDHATMTAFYRESVKRNDHCMVYSEAVLDVAKGPYTRIGAKDQVRIQKRRKISDLTAEDTVMIKLRSGIFTSFNLDVVKNRPDFLLDDFTSRYDLEFTDMMSYRDQLVYVISFRQKPSISELLFQGQIYLAQEDLAIVAADFQFNPDLIHKEPGLFLVSRTSNIRLRPLLAKYHVDYRSHKGKYYISQVRAELEMKIRRKRKWIGARYRIAIEMAVTDLLPNQRLRIDPSERLKPNIVLSDEPFQFDPRFWGIHNTIEPEASLLESIHKLKQNAGNN
jgi:hypothetical protein